MKVKKTAHYETGYIIFLSTVVETCGSSFCRCLKICGKTQMQHSKKSFFVMHARHCSIPGTIFLHSFFKVKNFYETGFKTLLLLL
jgi:hypothetical protein